MEHIFTTVGVKFAILCDEIHFEQWHEQRPARRSLFYPRFLLASYVTVLFRGTERCVI